MRLVGRVKCWIACFVVILLVVPVAVGLFTAKINQEEKAYLSTEKTINMVESLLEIASNKDDIDGIGNISQYSEEIDVFLGNYKESDVYGVWIVLIDPVSGIETVFDYHKLNLKPSDYYLSEPNTKRLSFSDDEGNWYYVSVKQPENSNLRIVAAAPELSYVEFFTVILSHAIFIQIFTLVIAGIFLWGIYKSIEKYYIRFADVLGSIIRSDQEVIDYGNDEFFDREYRILHSVRNMKKNALEPLNVAKTEMKKAEIALKSIVEGVVVTTVDCKILFINEVAERISGFSASEVVGKKFSTVFKFQDLQSQDRLPSPVSMIAKGSVESIADSKMMLVLGDRDDIVVSLSASPVKVEGGQVQEVIVLFRDITRDILTSEALKNSNSLLKANADSLEMIFEVARVAVWEYYPETEKVYGDNKLYSLLGIDEAEYMDFYSDVVARIEDSTELVSIIEGHKYEQGDRRFAIRLTFKGDDGRYRRLLCRGNGIASKDGQRVDRLQGILVDISEEESLLKELETQSRQNVISSTRLQQVYSMAKMFFWEYDAKSDVITGDKNFIKIFAKFGEGVTSGTREMAYQSIEPVYRDKMRKAVIEAQANGEKSCTVEFRTLPENEGVCGYMRNYFNFLYDDNNNVVASYGIIVDITEEHEQQMRLLHGSKMESIGALSGGIAHDFNNILSGISGMLNRIIERVKSVDSIAYDYCNSIRDICDGAGEFTQKLLSFSRKKNIQYENIDLNEVVENTAVILKHSITSKIRIDYNSMLVKPVVEGNLAELQNSILNLGINARDAILEKMDSVEAFDGQISIRVLEYDRQKHNKAAASLMCGSIDVDKEYVVIEVEDNGIGINEKNYHKIMEPFYTTKPENKGTGLGLSLIIETMIGHSGAVGLESTQGEGAVFMVFLPLVSVNNAVAAQGGNGADNEENGQESLTRGTILVIDDEAVMRVIYNQLLIEQGYNVIEAVDGNDGVRKYKENMADISGVIMDLQMPEMDGREAFLKIKKLDPDARIVFVSGYLGKSSERELHELGALAVLNKPFRKRAFVRNIDTLFADVVG